MPKEGAPDARTFLADVKHEYCSRKTRFSRFNMCTKS